MFFNYYGAFAMIPVIVLSIIIQFRLRKAYSKYSTINNTKGMTGAQIAERILSSAGVNDVSVVCGQGQLSDHYHPIKKTVSLSPEVFNGTSVAAIGIAAHECGHAIQHNISYLPLRFRTAIVGLTNFSTRLLYLLMIGSFLVFTEPTSTIIFNVATICYAVIFLFQLITLPVEFNASNRALKQIELFGFGNEDISGTRKVLSAAAMTYVATAVTSLWQLLLMINRNKRR